MFVRRLRRPPLRVRVSRFTILCLLLSAADSVIGNPLTLAQAERLALIDEPGLRARSEEAAALRDLAVADAQLPDPEASLAAFNFPVDSFSFTQEPITQVRATLRQRVPGGGELDARGAIRRGQASVVDAGAALRVRDVLRSVRLALADLRWRLDERERLASALELLGEIERAGLSGYGQGRGAQQDVLRARLEQQLLGDRLLANQAAIDQARAELARWIGDPGWSAEPVAAGIDLVDAGADVALTSHPSLRGLQAAEAVADRRIDLARSDYSPDWSVELAYGARDRLSPFGDRPDFLTAAVSFQLPLFTEQRQDRRLSASQGQREAARARHLDGVHELTRDLRSARVRQTELQARRERYAMDLLPLARSNVVAAQNGLAADVVDYAEVVRAALAEIDLGIELARIDWQLLRTEAQLAWLLGDATSLAFEEGLR